MKKLIISLWILSAALSASAKVTLPSVLSDGMVLQRNTDVTLWGKAAPGKKVIFPHRRRGVGRRGQARRSGLPFCYLSEETA